MRKTIIIGMCILLLLSFSAFAKQKTIIGAQFNGTGTTSGVTLVYNYTELLPWINNKTSDIANQLYVCKWFANYGPNGMWIPMRQAIKDLGQNTVTFYENNMPHQWALCIINPSAECQDFPYVGGFAEAKSGTTDLTSMAPSAMADVSDLKLKKESGSIQWTGNVNVCGAPLNQTVSTSASHVSVKVADLDPSINSTATVTLTGVTCNNFKLYYSPNFHESVGSLLLDPQKQAMATGNGGCNDPTICSNVVCNSETGVLTFTAYHFDSFGEGPNNGGGEPTIPEFSNMGIVLALIISILGIVYVVTKKD